MGEVEVHALAGVSFEIERGEMLAIMGPSGSGKSTLMNLLGCLDTPTEGTYHLAGRDVAALDDRELAEVRRETVGFVFQSFNLLPRSTVMRNVVMPMGYTRVSPNEREDRAASALSAVGLEERLWTHRSNELSGGQMQRLMIARIFLLKPKILLADEPTSMIDACSRATILDMLMKLHDETGMTLIFITHDIGLAYYVSNTVYIMEHGKFVESGSADDVILKPHEAYTKRLISDVPKIHEAWDLSTVKVDRI
jgi:peptide/nickel transport system ATP-binding protein